MTVKTLAETLASAPTATSLSGASMLLRNSAGGLAKYNPYVPSEVAMDLDSVTNPGTYVYGVTDNLIPGQDSSFNYGILEVFVRYGVPFQRITSVQLRMAIRLRYEGSWSVWEIIH